MTNIKICGMTQEADVDRAVELGVDAIGVVLWSGSPRHVGPETARALVKRLPPVVTPVAVFVSPTRDEIVHAVETIGCRVVQVHGPIDRDTLDVGGCQIVRAVSLSTVDGEVAPSVANGEPVLLDAHDPVRHGGTGRTIDWTRAALVARRRRIILAGGLTAANVVDAIRTVQPYGVDVASGVERAPGLKDHEAMRAFVDAVRTADSMSQTTVRDVVR